jgi:hypothetical protein
MQYSPMVYAMPVYRALATTIEARQNCVKAGNQEWQCRHSETLIQIAENCLPSGSGVDCGTKLDIEFSNPDKLVFDVDYHHMSDGGYYDGWTKHQVIVTPSLGHEFSLQITGPDRNDIKEYLHEIFHAALSEMLQPEPKLETVA